MAPAMATRLVCFVVSLICAKTLAFSLHRHESQMGIDLLKEDAAFSVHDSTELGNPDSAAQSILGTTMIRRSNNLSVSFSHLQLFVDKLDSLETYKQFEDFLNQYDAAATKSTMSTTDERRQLWESYLEGDVPEKAFVSQNRDIVKQLMAGVGFRVTGCRFPSDENTANTISLLMTSRDPRGVQILVSAIAADAEGHGEDELLHFDAGKLISDHRITRKHHFFSLFVRIFGEKRLSSAILSVPFKSPRHRSTWIRCE
jgi:hypothetical protein